MNARHRRVAAVAGTAACLALVLFMPEHSYTLRSLNQLHDFAHVPVFGFVALALVVLYSPAAWGPSSLDASAVRPRTLLMAFATAVSLGAAVEIAQGLIGRIPEVNDVLRDAAGAGATMAYLFSGRTSASGRLKWGCRIASTVLVLCLLGPVAVAAVDESRARRAFPVLADFEDPGQLDRFISDHADLERIAVPARADHALRVRFLPALYPRFGMRYFPGDWSHYRRLTFRAENPTDHPFRLVIRIHDAKHDGSFLDRFTTSRILQPGTTEVEIDLSVVELAPRWRRMDLRAVRGFVLYGVNVAQPQDLIFDDFRLTGEVGERRPPADNRPAAADPSHQAHG